MNERRLHFLLAMLGSIAVMVTAAPGRSVAAQEGTKDIGVMVPSEDVVARPAKSGTRSGNKPTRPKSASARNYRSPQPFTKQPGASQTEYPAVGVTIRRLQIPEDAKGMEQEGEEAQLEQLATDAPLNIGSRIRIYLEPLVRDGFVYVVDREQFADGTYGVPKLIFPTLRTRQGNNRVRANELIQIPRPPSYFRINPSSTGKTQVAEVLTIVITPTPLELPAALGDRAMTLNADQVKEWESKWSVPVTPFKMEGGAGQVERAKDLDQVGEEAQLTEDDPLPQTVYRVTVKKGNPLLVTVPLRFKAKP